jgi:hypothetical protein
LTENQLPEFPLFEAMDAGQLIERDALDSTRTWPALPIFID